MWCHLPAIISRRRSLTIAAVLLLIVAYITAVFFAHPAHAAAGINQQINFQGRLLNAQGATVPDGFYNIQFKIYQDGDSSGVGSTLKWTESHLNAASQGVTIKNGYFSTDLGSITAFGSNVDWNQDTLWLSMNVGGTNGSCTPFTSCSPDGEMLPMRRLSSSVYALNSRLLNGLTSSNFVQLAQGVQTDASTNTSSIFINKTSTGNLLQLQNAGADAFTLNNSGDLQFGANANHTLSVATAGAGVAGKTLTIGAGGGGSGSGAAGGSLTLQGGAAGGTDGNGGDVSINGGAKTGTGTDGNVNIGTANTKDIQIGSTTTAVTQNISIGNNATAGSTTNLTLGSGYNATNNGTTAVQSKGNTTISTGGASVMVARATFDSGADNGKLYLGNGITSGTPANFTIQATGGTGSSVGGSTLTIQGGNAGSSGNAAGGDLKLSGGTGIGTGVNGLVVLSTPTFQKSANDANCYTGGNPVGASCTITSASLDTSSSIIVGITNGVSGQTITLPDPLSASSLVAGRVVYITAANTSADFTLLVNGGVGVTNSIAMRQNTTATMIWNGNDWTAAGASSSTTLQAAYDNTLQSAGGAELIVAKTANTNGLTIRDSSANPVNGALVAVQSSSAANLFSVNSNVTEYANDPGAEVAFPASSWAAIDGNSAVTRYTTAGGNIATGQGSVSVVAQNNAQTGVKNTLTSTLTANNHYNVSFAARLSSGTFTDMNIYYSVDGSAASTQCGTTNQTISTSVWTKINCSFTAPSSGINASNAILIRQTTGSGGVRTFYVDNLSVTIAADYSLVADGGADAPGGIGTSGTTWNLATGGSATSSAFAQDPNDGQAASTSVKVTSLSNTANAGIRNKLAINPLMNTLYRVTVYAKLGSGSFTDFTVRYSPTGSQSSGASDYVNCVDYNTQTLSTSSWTKVTCYIQTDNTNSPTTPYLYFVQAAAPGSTRTFSVDTASMTLATASTPNVQIGSGTNGGPTTLFTLDKGASAPIAGDNEALLGSMYYDTSLGKLQCYEADGWGACGSSPDNIITISPEYTNAVMHGTGVGVMTSDLCSYTLGINDGQSGRPSICSTDETYNFYKWTSPQASDQAYSIYVTYQLPSTFKSFTSGSTSLQARVDSTSNAYVKMQIYKNHPGSSLATCGTNVTITSSVDTWQAPYASGAADPSTCGFVDGDSIVFKITMGSKSNANAYVGNIGFTFSNN